MKRFSIFVKSHCNYPDYESECEARNKREAIKIFAQEMRWEENDISDYVEEVK